MKVRIKQPVPVDDKHGMVPGAEFEVLLDDAGRPRKYNMHAWVMGEAGVQVKLWHHEYEVIQEEEDETTPEQDRTDPIERQQGE